MVDQYDAEEVQNAGRLNQIRMVAKLVNRQNKRALPIVFGSAVAIIAVFVVIGLVIGLLALFVLYYALNPRAGQREDSNRIVITADDLAQIQIAWMAQWHRPPTPEEMHNLLDGRIREEVLSREALALGLDKDDTIIKRRLSQKMEFVM